MVEGWSGSSSPRVPRDRLPRPPVSWQSVVVLVVLVAGVVGIVWACAWGVRG